MRRSHRLLLPLLLAAAPARAGVVLGGAQRPGAAVARGGRVSLGSPPTFLPPVSFEIAGNDPTDLVVADLDRDGALDLAVSGKSGNEIALVWNDGTGDFSDADDLPAVFAPYDPGPWGLATGDFDGDQNPDLAVTLGATINGLGQYNYKVHVFLGDGQRGFALSATLLSYGPFPIDCAAGDFDEDGHADLAVISNQYGLTVFPGNGDGTFGPRRPLVATFQPTAGRRLAAADLDEDGHLDLVASFSGQERVVWGDGSGVFDWGVSTSVGPGQHFALEDLDGDGHLDVVSSVADSWPSYLGGAWVLLGDGARGFAFAGRSGSSLGGWIATGDLNRDGFPDVVALEGGGLVRTYTGSGDGALVQRASWWIASDPTCLAVGDWDADGLGDVAAPWRNLGDTPGLAVLSNATP